MYARLASRPWNHGLAAGWRLMWLLAAVAPVSVGEVKGRDLGTVIMIGCDTYFDADMAGSVGQLCVTGGCSNQQP